METKNITEEDKKRLYTFLFICLTLIMVFGVVAYMFNDKSNVLEFLDIRPFPSLISILTGMVANIVFGMIDNGGLFFGMSALDPFLPKGELTRAGLGNTFSDGLGAFLGTFSGIIIKSITKIDDTPLWSDAIGIIIGCLIGLYVPKYITGKQ
jgi:hypothetical protein